MNVGKGDLWLFPAGFPHSIQGLGPDGCEFLLVFDQGDFSEDGTFLLSETVAHTPRNILAKNFRLDREVIAKLVRKEEHKEDSNFVLNDKTESLCSWEIKLQLFTVW